MNNKRQKAALNGILLALVLGGCAIGSGNDPFLRGKTEFFAKTKTVAVAPISYPEGVEPSEALSDQFEAMIEKKLTRAGWTVVQVRETEKIWARMFELVGGYDGQDSKKVDEAKYNAAWDHTSRELKRLMNVDAVMYPIIRVFNVDWVGSVVIWHGTSETIQSFGDVMMDNLPYAFFGLHITRSGTVNVLSLGITVEDINGLTLYDHNGGIQLLTKVSRGNYVAVPKKELLADEERNNAAVQFALRPLLDKPALPIDSQVASQRVNRN